MAIVVGVALAVLIGLAGRSDTAAEDEYCDSLTAMQADVQSLMSLDPGTATTDDFQSEADAIRSDWDDLKSSAEDLENLNRSQLESAWDGFEAAVQGIPDSSSVSEARQSVSEAARGLESALQTSIDAATCSSSSS